MGARSIANQSTIKKVAMRGHYSGQLLTAEHRVHYLVDGNGFRAGRAAAWH